MPLLRKIDPLVRLLLAMMFLASILPVTGSAREWAQDGVNAAVFLLFFLYGLRLSRSDVLAGLGNHKVLVPLILWVFGGMALAGFAIWQISAHWLPATLALGFLYLGVLPSTVQSATVYSSLAGGNVASSVVAAALLNILGVFISAPLFSLLAGHAGAGFQADALVKIILLLLFPFIAGQVLQGFVRGWVAENRKLIGFLDRSTIAIAVYVAFSGAVEQGIWTQVSLKDWSVLLAICALLLVFAYGGVWVLSGLLKVARADRITMLFAGAQKSVAMGAPLALVLFTPAEAGILLMPLLVYHLAQMIVAAPIAAKLGSAVSINK